MTDTEINVALAKLEGRKIHLVQSTVGFNYYDNCPNYVEDLNAVQNLMSSLDEEIQRKVATAIYNEASEYADKWVKFRCTTVQDVVLCSFFTPARVLCKTILAATGA